MDKERMFLRFIVAERDEESFQRKGIFGAAYQLLEEGNLTPADSNRLKEIIAWFRKNLPIPDESQLSARAIFWFKADAKAVIRQIWSLVEILREHDIEVDIVKTTRPGHIIYSDDHQVAATPFRDTF